MTGWDPHTLTIPSVHIVGVLKGRQVNDRTDRIIVFIGFLTLTLPLWAAVYALVQVMK